MASALLSPPITSPTPPYPQVPVVEQGMAVLCLLANVFIPGLGTIVGGIIGGKPLIGRGVAQFFLTLIIVGWVWGVVTGFQLLQNAVWAEKTPGAPKPA